MNQRKGNRKRKPDVTIMTLLAYECPKEATDLLMSQGFKKAKNHKDLEHKLGEMYAKCDDKAELEKKLAAIHPHKNWLMRVSEPEIKKSIKVEPDPEATEDVRVDPKLIKRVELLEQRSDFFGVNKADQESTPAPSNEDKMIGKMAVFGMVTVVAVIGLAVVANMRHQKV